MDWLKTVRPTPALIVAMVALVTAMSGAAIALPGKGTVSTNDIKKAAITKKLIAKGAVGSQQIIGKSIKGNRIKDGGVKAKQIADATITDKKIADATITGQKLADATITGKQVADDGLSDKNISDYDVIGDGSFVKLTATEAPTLAGALAAAPETVLFSKGQLTIYAKCYRDTTAGEIEGGIYARTSANGAILQGDSNLPSGDAVLLDTNTAEADRGIQTTSTTVADAGNVAEVESVLIGADGTDLQILSHVATKQGTFPGGNGAYGDGNVCLFGGEISG
jgi:hypothetical protein